MKLESLRNYWSRELDTSANISKLAEKFSSILEAMLEENSAVKTLRTNDLGDSNLPPLVKEVLYVLGFREWDLITVKIPKSLPRRIQIILAEFVRSSIKN